MNILSFFIIVPLLMLASLWTSRSVNQVRGVMVVGSSILLALSVYLTIDYIELRQAGATGEMLFTASTVWYAPLHICDTRAGKQFVWICCSLGLGFILMMLEDKLYDMFAYILYGGMMLLLLITPFLAEDTKGSYSWIKFGPVSLQPAEFAKFATALALAKFMNVYGDRKSTRLNSSHSAVSRMPSSA